MYRFLRDNLFSLAFILSLAVLPFFSMDRVTAAENNTLSSDAKVELAHRGGGHWGGGHGHWGGHRHGGWGGYGGWGGRYYSYPYYWGGGSSYYPYYYNSYYYPYYYYDNYPYYYRSYSTPGVYFYLR